MSYLIKGPYSNHTLSILYGMYTQKKIRSLLMPSRTVELLKDKSMARFTILTLSFDTVYNTFFVKNIIFTCSRSSSRVRGYAWAASSTGIRYGGYSR